MKNIASIPKSIGVFTETYRQLQLAKTFPRQSQEIKNTWAENILKRLNIETTIYGAVSLERPLLFVGNHISYLDILLMIKATQDCSFVAKSELRSWPVFGAAAKYLDTVFVQRESANSRQAARKSIHDAFDAGKRIVVFPSGTTSLDERKAWRRGAFEIAAERNLWVQPFRINYTPLRSVAYIDNDLFPLHLNNLFGCEKIKALIEFHEPVKIKDPATDSLYWQYWTREAVSILTCSSPTSNNLNLNFA